MLETTTIIMLYYFDRVNGSTESICVDCYKSKNFKENYNSKLQFTFYF